ncbi:MAG: tetratricopeptide repeat protein [Methylacidiphilales bacterium]|nr:tetratricopeptide repeat protein [Candidatus Methylacidiphilales bacterium]
MLSQELQVLRALYEGGPCLPFEVAVRVRKFPEEIGHTLQILIVSGLIRSDRFGGSLLGNELLSITPIGIRLLQCFDTAERQISTNIGKCATSSREFTEEWVAELLHKLGDIAAACGDTENAVRYYQGALKILRHFNNSFTL